MTKHSFTDLVELMHTLRGPNGCPWDREQSYETLRPFVVEEAYEVVDAIDRDDRGALVEEIGDLLLEAVFLAELGREEGSFDIDDATTAVHQKLVRRHPHVFADAVAEDADQVITNWERLKRQEKHEKEERFFKSIPTGLPALLKAVRLTEKAARVGFDWQKTEDVFEKLDEETREFREAMERNDRDEMERELGDILFTIANVARKLGIDAENALQGTNRKFIRRFEAIEMAARNEGRKLEEMSLDELDARWNEVKESEAK